ncbi:hypothetical protein BAUCODRAFT_124737 [Baudoinia panamericana UAMH 10762]|uniref:DUF7962 domain-containing protein n=1 Tax=Baudoinia panamericana (strain UAMH 10762) TaxID=717646 RepID=M2MBX9_BAUPA|nr:uncharacterized protein BAUCODRAFT_124737 [Baudoinia panamericana UAMH 10762]EMC93991.1 hypothetical protein BAUCODRAFT_124737 [Baudoinia panamericana UAMH 10762]
MQGDVPDGLVLFHYPLSPYGRRCCWYLALRHIAYAECVREAPHDHTALGRTAALLNKFSIDASVFYKAVQTMPTTHPALSNQRFVKDRAGFYTDDWTMQQAVRQRPEDLVNLCQCWGIADSLFAHGREWVAGTSKPSLADLEALYPEVYSWRSRFVAIVRDARALAPKPVSLQAEFSNKELFVDADDPLKIEADTMVELFPTDGGGLTHQDRGRLVKLTKNEVAIAMQTKTGEEVHIHAPRWQFRIRVLDGGAKL